MKENNACTQGSAVFSGSDWQRLTTLNLDGGKNIWPSSSSDEILVVPIGGVGRIGMNWTLYGYQDQWLLVDAGIGFGEDEWSGFQIIPDPAFLEELEGRLLGLVITHAHQDHIGAIDMVWPHYLNCPIWASSFAAELLKARLQEAGTLDEVTINEFTPGDSFQIGDFSIKTVAVTHSVPEPVALVILTGAGTLVHSGDWKIDLDPVVGSPPDLETFAQIGNQGVLALVSDSTNASHDLSFSSEREVFYAFESLFETTPGIVVVCCFGSNVARLASAAKAALHSGRKIAVAGRSMQTSERIASKLGLLDENDFLDKPSHLAGLDHREIALICTGGQGEPQAALARIANAGIKGLPSLGVGDCVVISSRVIPGNEEAVDLILSNLTMSGVEVITNDTLIDGYPVHVSGHAGKAEIDQMYGLLKPKFSIPVHGKKEHLDAHSEIAKKNGSQVALVKEGGVLAISASGVTQRTSLQFPILKIKREETVSQARANVMGLTI